MVDDAIDVGEDMRCEEDRLPLIARRFESGVEEVPARDHVESQPRVVQDEKVRVLGEGKEELGPTPLSQTHVTQRDVAAHFHPIGESLATVHVPGLEERGDESQQPR